MATSTDPAQQSPPSAVPYAEWAAPEAVRRAAAEEAAAEAALKEIHHAMRLRWVATLIAMGHTCVRLENCPPAVRWCVCLSRCAGQHIGLHEVDKSSIDRRLAADLGAQGHVCLALAAASMRRMAGGALMLRGLPLHGWCREFGFCAQLADGQPGSRTAPWVGEPVPADDGDIGGAAAEPEPAQQAGA